MRQVSQDGIELIKRFEGLEVQSYRDVAGIWTIGYGHTGPEVGPGMRISEGEAEQLLARDLERFEEGVAGAVTAPITQAQFDALVSLSYNIGVGAFRRSTALRRLNKGDFEGAAEAITWWNKATVNGRKRPVLGLTRRRAAEAALFLQDVHDDAVAGRGVVVEENSPRRRNPMNSRTVGGATTAGTAGAVGAGSVIMGERAPGVPDGEVGDDVVARDDGADEDAALAGTDAGTGGCIDPETGAYLTPAELEDEPGQDPEPDPDPETEPGTDDGAVTDGPIHGAAARAALDAVDPPLCDGVQLAEATAEVGAPAPARPDGTETADAVGIGAGALAVLAALYTIGARLDDWWKYRR